MFFQNFSGIMFRIDSNRNDSEIWIAKKGFFDLKFMINKFYFFKDKLKLGTKKPSCLIFNKTVFDLVVFQLFYF